MTRLVLSLALASCLAGAALADGAKAAKIFRAKCASCHGADGKGDTEVGKKLKVPDFTQKDFQAKVKDDELKSVINEGKKGDKTIEDHAFAAKVGADLDEMVKIVRGFGKK
jgi:mono/diheme cytochrome c family protein